MKLLACGVEKESEILVLSPYRAQCHIIEQELAANQLSEVSVTSIVKSQGTFERKEIVVVKLKNLTLACWQVSKVEQGEKERRTIRWSQAWPKGGGGGKGEEGGEACRRCFDATHPWCRTLLSWYDWSDLTIDKWAMNIPTCARMLLWPA